LDLYPGYMFADVFGCSELSGKFPALDLEI